MDLSKIDTKQLENFKNLLTLAYGENDRGVKAVMAEINGRKSRQFYTNHPKMSPSVGDTVRLARDMGSYNLLWFFTAKGWINISGRTIIDPFDGIVPGLCELLVDGDTARTV